VLGNSAWVHKQDCTNIALLLCACCCGHAAQRPTTGSGWRAREASVTVYARTLHPGYSLEIAGSRAKHRDMFSLHEIGSCPSCAAHNFGCRRSAPIHPCALVGSPRQRARVNNGPALWTYVEGGKGHLGAGQEQRLPCGRGSEPTAAGWLNIYHKTTTCDTATTPLASVAKNEAPYDKTR